MAPRQRTEHATAEAGDASTDNRLAARLAQLDQRIAGGTQAVAATRQRQRTARDVNRRGRQGAGQLRRHHLVQAVARARRAASRGVTLSPGSDRASSSTAPPTRPTSTWWPPSRARGVRRRSSASRRIPPRHAQRARWYRLSTAVARRPRARLPGTALTVRSTPPSAARDGGPQAASPPRNEREKVAREPAGFRPIPRERGRHRLSRCRRTKVVPRARSSFDERVFACHGGSWTDDDDDATRARRRATTPPRSSPASTSAGWRAAPSRPPPSRPRARSGS